MNPEQGSEYNIRHTGLCFVSYFQKTTRTQLEFNLLCSYSKTVLENKTIKGLPRCVEWVCFSATTIFCFFKFRTVCRKVWGWCGVSSGRSRISLRWGGTNSPGALTHDFAKCSYKLHEIERIWTPRGRPSLVTPLRSANDRHSSWSHLWQLKVTLLSRLKLLLAWPSYILHFSVFVWLFYNLFLDS